MWRGAVPVYLIVGVVNVGLGLLDLVKWHLYLDAFPAISAGLVFVVFAWHVRLMYRMGWQRGRRELINSMGEAQQRGLSPREWIMAEIERTEGVDLRPPSPEG